MRISTALVGGKIREADGLLSAWIKTRVSGDSDRAARALKNARPKWRSG